MQAFAASSLVELIRAWLERAGPGRVPGGEVDSLRQARTGAELKRRLLRRAVGTAGLLAPLEAGCMVERVSHHPIWRAALRSTGPWVLFDKWRRFESFAHSTNRLQIERMGESAAAFRRGRVGGGAPQPAENLFICGLMTGLLEGIGCEGLECRMPRQGGADWILRRGGGFRLPDAPDTLDTAGWTMRWARIAPPARPHETGTRDLPVPAGLEGSAEARTLRRAAALMAADPARRWTVAELSRDCRLSPRTLQRRLGAASFPFSRLTRLIRVHEASRLLAGGGMSATATAFCAGFSDSAHLSRDFHAVMGMTPTQYAALHRDAERPPVSVLLQFSPDVGVNS